jgi:nucleotide-binding universal stress UspA family protein
MKIIIATDGSEFSKVAIEKGCQMVVKPAETSIKIVSVYEKLAPMGTEPFAVSSEYYHEVEKAAKKQAEAFVAQAADLIKTAFPDSGITIETEAVMGAPDHTIVEIAKDWNADLIIVGSHGHGFWGRMMLGSVSDSIMHHAPCSVMIVRQRVKPNDD